MRPNMARTKRARDGARASVFIGRGGQASSLSPSWRAPAGARALAPGTFAAQRTRPGQGDSVRGSPASAVASDPARVGSHSGAPAGSSDPVGPCRCARTAWRVKSAKQIHQAPSSRIWPSPYVHIHHRPAALRLLKCVEIAIGIGFVWRFFVQQATQIDEEFLGRFPFALPGSGPLLDELGEFMGAIIAHERGSPMFAAHINA